MVRSDIKSVKIDLIMNKAMIIIYIDIVYIFYSHWNQDANVIICIIKLDGFILRLPELY